MTRATGWLGRAAAAIAMLAMGAIAAQAAGAAERALPEVFLPQVAPFVGDLDGVLQRRQLRILVPYDRTLYFLDRGRQLGLVADMARRFETWFVARHGKAAPGLKVVVVPVRAGDLLRALQVGRGDVAAGNLLVTPARASEVDFAEPFTTAASDILVTGPSAPPLASLDDMAGRDLFLRKSTPTMDRARAWAETFAARGLAAPVIKGADVNLQDEDLLEMVAAGLLPYAVVDVPRATVWAQVLPGLTPRPDLVVAQGGALAWAVRKGNTALRDEVSAFARETGLPLSFSPEVAATQFRPEERLRNALAGADLARARALSPVFKDKVPAAGFDPLMLMALGYAESGLDQGRRGPGGAVGVMQIRPADAAAKPIGIRGVETDPARNIQAAALRLRRMVETAVGAQAAIDERDHVLLAILAAKAGPAALARWRTRVQAMGLDPDSWFDNIDIAVARSDGRELVRFIGRVHKYFVAYGLLAYGGAMPPSRMDQTVVPRLPPSN